MSKVVSLQPSHNVGTAQQNKQPVTDYQKQACIDRSTWAGDETVVIQRPSAAIRTP